MGNRSGCSLFSTLADTSSNQSFFGDRTLWLDDFTEEENLLLKRLYTDMCLSTKCMTPLELKRTLDLHLSFLRTRHLVSPLLDAVHTRLA